MTCTQNRGNPVLACTDSTVQMTGQSIDCMHKMTHIASVYKTNPLYKRHNYYNVILCIIKYQQEL